MGKSVILVSLFFDRGASTYHRSLSEWRVMVGHALGILRGFHDEEINLATDKAMEKVVDAKSRSLTLCE